MKTYSEKLKDPRWQKRRLEIMSRDNFKCCDCEESDKMLSVHHAYYVSGRDPWNYPEWALQTLCNECHKDRHSAPGPDEEPSFQEWEYEMEWILKGDPRNISRFWDFFAEIAQTLDLADDDRMKASQMVAHHIAVLGSSYRERAVK